MATINGYPASFYKVTAPKWCRHKDQYLVYEVGVAYVRVTCANCSADTGQVAAPLLYGESVAVRSERARRLGHDALMKIEKVGTVSEVAAP